jgi:hypothetical protein
MSDSKTTNGPREPLTEFLVKIRDDAFSNDDALAAIVHEIRNEPNVEVLDPSVAGPDLLKIAATQSSATHLQQKLAGKIDMAPNEPLPDPRLKPTVPFD